MSCLRCGTRRVGRGVDRRRTGCRCRARRGPSSGPADQLVAIEAERHGAAHARILERVHVACAYAPAGAPTDFRLMMSTFGSLSRPTPGSTGIWLMMSTCPPCSARICGCMSVKKMNSVRSGSAFGAPVVLVADEGGADLRRVLLELERAGAVEALLEVALVARRHDDRRCSCPTTPCRGSCRSARRGGIRPCSRRPSSSAALRRDAVEHRQRVGRVGRIGKPVDAGHHVVGLHLAARVEFHALAQLEGPHRAVLRSASSFRPAPAAAPDRGRRRRGIRRPAAASAGRRRRQWSPDRWPPPARCWRRGWWRPARLGRGPSDGMPPKPAAVVMPPSSGSDRPSRLPWRRNSRRLTRPSTSPSIRWFSSGVRWRRMRSRRR